MKKLFAFLIAFHLMVIPIKAHAFIGGMGQITGIAIAAVGVGLVGACKPITPSIGLYMAAAAVYLVGELTGGKEQKGNLEKTDADLNKLKDQHKMGGEVQLASIEAQIKDKEEKKKLAEKRSRWMGLSSGMMFAAGALAAAELIPIPLLSACEPGTAIALGSKSSAAVIAGYSFLAGGGLMGALMGAVLGMVVAQGTIASLFSTPVGRAAGMAASGALVMAAKGPVDSEISKLKNEIDQLKKIRDQFRRETDGTGPSTEDTLAGTTSGVTSGVSSGSTSGAGNGSSLTMLPSGTTSSGTVTCLSSGGELSTNCSNPMKFSAPNLSMFGDQPELQQVASQGVQVANLAAQGDTGRADIGVANLGSAASKMRDALSKQIAKTNSRLRAQGKKPIDFEKEQRDVLKTMQAAFDKEMKGKQQTLAALGTDGKLSLDPSKSNSQFQNINTAAVDSAVAVPAADGQVAQAVAEGAGVPATSDAAQSASATSATDALVKNLDEYETAENDISKNTEASLWKQVSNRYLLNYDRFFERKKVPAPAQ